MNNISCFFSVGGALIEAMNKRKEDYMYYGTYNEHPQEFMTPFQFERAAKYDQFLLTITVNINFLTYSRRGYFNQLIICYRPSPNSAWYKVTIIIIILFET